MVTNEIGRSAPVPFLIFTGFLGQSRKNQLQGAIIEINNELEVFVQISKTEFISILLWLKHVRFVFNCTETAKKKITKWRG